MFISERMICNLVISKIISLQLQKKTIQINVITWQPLSYFKTEIKELLIHETFLKEKEIPVSQLRPV